MDQGSNNQPQSSAARAGGDNLSSLSPTSDLSLSVADVINPEKYQRLAAEYAKLRAQFAVLKKGILEEKAKSEELGEMVKARDQAARRAAQETESLVFRNQQLTRRIAVLQNEIEQGEAGSGSTPQKRAAGFLFAGDVKNRSASNVSNTSSGNLATSGAGAVDANVVEEIHQELRSKLEENERLQELVRTLEATREQELKTLERRLKEEGEVKANHQLETVTGELRSVRAELAKMKAEKSAGEGKLAECLKSLQETTASVETLKEENAQLKSRLSVAEKQVIAARQNARLQAARTASTLNRVTPDPSEAPEEITTAQPSAASATPLSAVPNGLIPRSGSFSGIIRSSGSFSRGVSAAGGGGGPGIIRSGSLSINHSGSPALASLLATTNSQLSQSTKDLGISGGGAGDSLLSTSPSSALLGTSNSHNYKDLQVRQRLITEFATKVAEITCALSTLHSNVSKKISILYALLNNSVPHLYFFDVAAFKEAQAAAKESGQSVEEVAASVGRSEYVQNILRKFNDSLKLYDSHLVILEESIHQYLSAKVRLNAQDQTGSGAELAVIEQELAKHGRDILEKFTDYVNYLNKINPYMSLCVALWCKNISEYDPENEELVAAVGLDAAARTKLANGELRAALCAKHEQFATSVTNCIRIIGQIASQVKLLLSRSAQLNNNYLTVFNHLMHRVNALEKAFDETKTLFTSKLALEHDLGVTVAADLLSVDDAILSSMVFFRRAIIDMRLMVEMHYFFFVSHGSSNKSASVSAGGSSAAISSSNSSSANGALASSPLGTTSPLGAATALSGQLIPEEEDEEEEEEEEEEDEVEEEEDVEMKAEERSAKKTSPSQNSASSTSGGIRDEEDEDYEEDSSPEKRMKMRQTTTTKATRSLQQISEDSHLQKELQTLQAEKEQWTIETEWRTLKLAEEQRKVAELELRVQELLTQKQQGQSQHQSSTSMIITPSTTSNQLPLKRANSNTNSLASNKSLDNAAAGAAAITEQTSISSAASLKSPTLDCFGTVVYPAISAADDEQQTVSTDTLKNLAVFDDGDKQQQTSTTTAYFQSQMTALVNALQTTDARAAALESDCLSLRAQLLALAGEKADLESRLTAHHQTMGRIEEEYQTSVENYEQQLRTMSEHLAELNEKLTGQRETIDILQYQQQQQQQQSGKTSSSSASSSSAAASAASNVVKTFRRSFKKQ